MPEPNIDEDDSDSNDNNNNIEDGNNDNLQQLNKNNTNSNDIILKDQNTQLIQKIVTPSDYYLSKEYKGLVVSISEDREKDVKIYEGQSGLPFNYSYR